MELSQPFVRLPFNFDVERLSAELAQFKQADWMKHPSGFKGNLAIPLISHRGEKNNDFDGRMAPSAHLNRCSYMQQVMGSFNEVLARSRLMRLNSGCEVTAHVDFNYHWYSRVRIHIPIVTNPDVIFHCGDQQLHMQAGECWIFDSWRWHNVINSGAQDRVHLVIDTAGSSRFWNMVRDMEHFGIAPNNSQLQQDLLEKINMVPYQEGAKVDLKTERYNTSPVMSPGELNAIALEVIADFTNHSANDPQIVQEYTQLLTDLSKDWREIWHLHGFEQAGFPKYLKLLEKTLSQLRPNPRAIITASNQVGANPIIVQRILRAALHTDQLEAFQNS